MKKRDPNKQQQLQKRTTKRAQYEKERKKKYALSKAAASENSK